MANEKHVKILRKGVQAWNKWRQKHPQILPDLSRVDLIKADLLYADLTRADLTEAHLAGARLIETTLLHADLTRADLTEAHLTGADLLYADLTGADLTRADLTGAHLAGARLIETTLTGACLVQAHLTGATLTGATLTGATLHRAEFRETIFSNNNLTMTKGLDSCRHYGPSTIDHRTLMRSGPLPLTFLRGCGLPDTFIDYLPSLFNEPLQFDSCFISYSSEDEEFARRLHADLQNNSVRCWFAPEDMKIGDEFRSRIDQAIHVHDRLLLILSEHSVDSRWVQKEVETAFEKEERGKRLVLFPVRIDSAVMDSTVGWAADIRRQRHIGDFRQWKDHDAYQQVFTRLLRDLKAEAEQREKK